MSLNIGFIDYIHSYPINAPFRLQKMDPLAQLVYANPLKLNELLKTRFLEASFISLAEYLEGKDELYDFCPPFVIAAHKQIFSVNLYYRESITSLDGAKVGIFKESTTSVLLLKVLCHHFWKISPEFVSLESLSWEQYSGILLIGDEALTHQTIPGFKTLDLASAWNEVTDLPFVFALFASHKSLTTSQKEKLNLFIDKLEKALTWSKEHMSIIEMLAQKKTGLPLDLIQKYYQTCVYHFEKKHQQTIQLFERLAYALYINGPLVDKKTVQFDRAPL